MKPIQPETLEQVSQLLNHTSPGFSVSNVRKAVQVLYAGLDESDKSSVNLEAVLSSVYIIVDELVANHKIPRGMAPRTPLDTVATEEEEKRLNDSFDKLTRYDHEFVMLFTGIAAQTFIKRALRNDPDKLPSLVTEKVIQIWYNSGV